MSDVPPPPGQQPPPAGSAGWGSGPATGFGGGTQDHAPGALLALIFGILGLTFLPVIGSILALVFGYQSRNAARAEPGRYNEQLGQIGRILGWVGLGLTVAVIVVIVLGLLFFFAVGTAAVA